VGEAGEIARSGHDLLLSVDTHLESGVVCVNVRGELDLATAPQLAVRLDALRTSIRPRVLIDLSGLEFCDSTGLRVVIGAARELRAAGGRVVVACPGAGPVGRLLEIVGATEWLDVHEDAELALAALTPRRA
jgi:anti-anti-sigma factor